MRAENFVYLRLFALLNLDLKSSRGLSDESWRKKERLGKNNFHHIFPFIKKLLNGQVI